MQIKGHKKVHIIDWIFFSVENALIASPAEKQAVNDEKLPLIIKKHENIST